MASIRKEALIDASPDEVWDAVRDWGALHERLVPGFATGARVEGDARIVTFFTGAVVRERFVALDESERRLVWSIVDGPYEHHNASAQVFPADGGRTRFVWQADLLPDAAAERTSELMERGTGVVKETLEAAARR
ncbi:MAG TPA: SRPBCC family protein [Thermoleophilaceae bacterium]|jgi:uncharacterized protein YndB with AHSA1/START domain